MYVKHATIRAVVMWKLYLCWHLSLTYFFNWCLCFAEKNPKKWWMIQFTIPLNSCTWKLWITCSELTLWEKRFWLAWQLNRLMKFCFSFLAWAGSTGEIRRFRISSWTAFDRKVSVCTCNCGNTLSSCHIISYFTFCIL